MRKPTQQIYLFMYYLFSEPMQPEQFHEEQIHFSPEPVI